MSSVVLTQSDLAYYEKHPRYGWGGGGTRTDRQTDRLGRWMQQGRHLATPRPVRTVVSLPACVRRLDEISKGYFVLLPAADETPACYKLGCIESQWKEWGRENRFSDEGKTIDHLLVCVNSTCMCRGGLRRQGELRRVAADGRHGRRPTQPPERTHQPRRRPSIPHQAWYAQPSRLHTHCNDCIRISPSI